MNNRRVEIEGTNKTFEYKCRTFRTNIDDIRRFVLSFIYNTYRIKGRDLNLLNVSMQILIYKDNLKQKIKIVVTFAEVESKTNFNPLFSRINTYKVYINDLGLDMVKTALNVLETKINEKLIN